MKKILIILTFIILTTSCSLNKKENLIIKWPLSDDILPTFKFDRSIKKDEKLTYYVDKQITLSDFINYVKKLEENNFKVDWRYSDISSSNELNDSKILDDGYINYMLFDETTCLFMQFVDINKYNSLNKDKKVLYSFKIKIEHK